MILLLHIIIALATLVSSALSVFAPTVPKLKTTYVLTALTALSGTYLVISQPATLVHACISGLICLSIAFGAIAFARTKLATESVRGK